MKESFRSPPDGQGWAPPAWPSPSTDWNWGPPPSRHPKRVLPLAGAIAVLLVAGFVGVAVHGGGGGTGHSQTRQPVATPPISGTVVPTPPVSPVTPVTRMAPPVTKVAPASTSLIAGLVNASVVDVYAKLGYQHAVAAGTGMILTSTGVILTNNHVIDGATSIVVTVVASRRNYPAKVVGVNPSSDVAVLQLQGASGLKAIRQGDPSLVAQGDPVFAIGNAGGIGGTPTIVTGRVEATGVSVTAKDASGANAERLNGLIETTTPLQPGDSGGPLVNNDGLVIGMDTAAATGTTLESTVSVGFAIPIDQALLIAQQIQSGQASNTVHIGLPGFLGVQVAPRQPATGPAGAVVSSVESGSPAESAGLVAGSVITAVDGQAISSGQVLTSVMQSHHPGDRVTVGWLDPSGARHQATVTLITGPTN